MPFFEASYHLLPKLTIYYCVLPLIKFSEIIKFVYLMLISSHWNITMLRARISSFFFFKFLYPLYLEQGQVHG